MPPSCLDRLEYGEFAAGWVDQAGTDGQRIVEEVRQMTQRSMFFAVVAALWISSAYPSQVELHGVRTIGSVSAYVNGGRNSFLAVHDAQAAACRWSMCRDRFIACPHMDAMNGPPASVRSRAHSLSVNDS